MATPIDEWSAGRLLSTAARMVEHHWNVWLAQHELTHAGFLALHALGEGPMTQRGLAAASRVEEQTMSRVVERLARTGHVSRTRDAADRRRLLVQRTELGERTYEAIQASDVSDQLVDEALLDPAQFRAELIRLIRQLGTAPIEPP
jgi:MarR family transcriptional regulator, organic hydroperoxide resistance regulator